MGCKLASPRPTLQNVTLLRPTDFVKYDQLESQVRHYPARFGVMPRPESRRSPIPIASNVGSRDVTWAFRAQRLSSPSFSRVSRAIIPDRSSCPLRPSVHLPLHVFWTSTPDRAGARPYRVQCRVARCDMGLPAHASHPLSRFSRVSRAIIPDRSMRVLTDETQFCASAIARFLTYLRRIAQESSSRLSVGINSVWTWSNSAVARLWTCHAGSRRSASLPRPMSGRAM